MPDIKYFYTPGACSFAPHILLRKAGLPFEPVKVALFEGEHMQPEFTRINPKQRVPVLSLDGDIITEVPAISTAIGDLVPEHHLMGRTPKERARVYEWMNWLSGTLHGQAFAGLWRPLRFSDDDSIFETIQAKGRMTIAECFAFIEERLNDPYAAGNEFTAADAFLLVFYRWGYAVGFDMAASYPKYTALAEKLGGLDWVIAAADAEGINPLRDQPPPLS